MRAVNLAGAVAIALTFGTMMGLAQSQADVCDGSNAKPMPTATPVYNADIGALHWRGHDTKPMSTTTPGYTGGTGSTQAGSGYWLGVRGG